MRAAILSAGTAYSVRVVTAAIDEAEVKKLENAATRLGGSTVGEVPTLRR